MGTDIHGVIATREFNPRYVRATRWTKITDLNLVTMLDRDYDSFAVLANVRNGTGFAGCKTSDGFNSISEPRGLPEWLEVDESGEHIKDTDIWLGEHSFSFVTLAELLDFDWSQEVIRRGVVPLAEYKRWSKDRTFRMEYDFPSVAPREYSGDVCGPTVVIHEDSPDLDVEKLLGDVCQHHYVRCSWVEKYFRTTPLIWNTIIPEMLAQCKKDKTIETRTYFVFGFDS